MSKEKRARLNVTIPAEIVFKAKVLVAMEQTTLNDVVARALAAYTSDLNLEDIYGKTGKELIAEKKSF